MGRNSNIHLTAVLLALSIGTGVSAQNFKSGQELYNYILQNPDADESKIEKILSKTDQAVIDSARTLYYRDVVRDFQAVVLTDADSAATDTSDIVSRRWYSLYTITRSYGDSITVRWAPEKYVPWKWLNESGYQIERLSRDQETVLKIDTLAVIRPRPLEEWEKLFPKTDTVAMAAASLLYGKRSSLDGKLQSDDVMQSVSDVYDEQQNIFGMAMTLAEIRPDIARAMGLSYTDHDVKPGEEYMYIVRGAVSTDIFPVSPVVQPFFKNTEYVPEPLNAEISDSITPPDMVTLEWPPLDYAVYDIERSTDGKNWKALNERPYLVLMQQLDGVDQPNRYVDRGLEPGTYRYRLRGYDSFGDRTAPSPEHVVTVKDVTPPLPPRLTHIEILRPDTAVLARFEWVRESDMEPDFAGYVPMYLQPQLQTWIPLTKDIVPATDTCVTVRVTGLATSDVAVAAVDTAGNMAYGMPQTIRIADLVPPEPPTNLRSAISADGVVRLVWSPSPSNDVSHYEVYEANDTLHRFLQVPDAYNLADTVYMDTLDTQVADLFHYYMVRAVDWSGNVSDFTPVYERMRPNYNPPSTCLIDSLWQDDNAVHMNWSTAPDEDIAVYRVFRKLGADSNSWTLVRRFERGEWPDGILHVDDSPAYEQRQRYYYAVEGINLTGVSSGLSMQISVSHRGPLVFDVPIRLSATYREDYGCVVLAWEHDSLPSNDRFHYVVYKTTDMDDDDSFKPFITTPSDELTTNDYRLSEEQSARYFVMALFEDGRRSVPSDVVTVTRPKQKEMTEEEREQLRKQRAKSGVGKFNDF